MTTVTGVTGSIGNIDIFLRVISLDSIWIYEPLFKINLDNPKKCNPGWNKEITFSFRQGTESYFCSSNKNHHSGFLLDNGWESAFIVSLSDDVIVRYDLIVQVLAWRRFYSDRDFSQDSSTESLSKNRSISCFFLSHRSAIDGKLMVRTSQWPRSSIQYTETYRHSLGVVQKPISLQKTLLKVLCGSRYQFFPKTYFQWYYNPPFPF